MTSSRILTTVLIVASLAPACGQDSANPTVLLEEVASSSHQWTGVAVSAEGRVFVNFPRWSDDVPISLGELQSDGRVLPYPNTDWNQWTPQTDPGTHFVCVQSVVVDRNNRLWVLDPANPKFGGVVPGGAKLVCFDLERNSVRRVIHFDQHLTPPGAYLNDVRIDVRRRVVYITDSGLGALVVIDLATGQMRRVLDEHPSTKAEAITLTIDGKPWLRPDGSAPSVHADGLALDSSGQMLYYQALTGRSLYAIDTRWLLVDSLDPQIVASQVQWLGRTGAADGIMFGDDDRLYLSGLEENAIKRLLLSGHTETIVQDERLRWPDSFARGPDGYLYVTTSQIHLLPEPDQPYHIFRFKPPNRAE